MNKLGNWLIQCTGHDANRVSPSERINDGDVSYSFVWRLHAYQNQNCFCWEQKSHIAVPFL